MFNYQKLAVAQAQSAADKAALALAKELYERLLATKDAEIARLKEQNDALRGKNSLMETILMPLSSAAGAAYQEAQNPQTGEKPNFKAILESNTTEWQRYKRRKEQELEQAYEDSDARKE